MIKIKSATCYLMRIPFRESFSHTLHTRKYSDSIILKLVTSNGIEGYGEGIARPYVTGETVKSAIDYIKTVLLPAILRKDLNLTCDASLFASINLLLPNTHSTAVVAWHAARTAVELALLDCILKEQSLSLADLLPPVRKKIIYSLVIGTGTLAKIKRRTFLFKLLGSKFIKLKVEKPTDRSHLAVVRNILGSAVSIRLDANGAFDTSTAMHFIKSIVEFNIASLEQPIPRGSITELTKLKHFSPIPIMVDESLVTIQDAQHLIENQACDYFNLRLSKCGGIHNTLVIAAMARQAGIGIQLGCQVGETAILSAVGRHLAAYLPELSFVEGSFGSHLLVRDIARKSLNFGWGGRASLIKTPGLGAEIDETIVKKYSTEVITIS